MIQIILNSVQIELIKIFSEATLGNNFNLFLAHVHLALLIQFGDGNDTVNIRLFFSLIVCLRICTENSLASQTVVVVDLLIH